MRLYNLCEWACAQMCISLKRKLAVILCLVFIYTLFVQWNLMCTDMQARMYVQGICSDYKKGKVVGNLCHDICETDGISSVTCHLFYQDKDVIFSGIWKNKSYVFKTVKSIPSGKQEQIIDEDVFIHNVKNTIKDKFNMSIDIIDAKRMTYIQHNQKGMSRYLEMQNAWPLLQNNEYLALTLYEKYNIFPKIEGTCGSMYAAEQLHVVAGFSYLMAIYDTKAKWLARVRISLKILDFLIMLDDGLPEPLQLCDVKINNFGMTLDLKKIMYLDLDSVHPHSVANRITASGKDCKKHSDCDYLDCRSFCDLVTFKCQHGVVNNNLQIVCEKVFLGWVLSGKVMAPGMLIGPGAPRVLTQVLELCANPLTETGTPRAPATKEVRMLLYSLLTHMLEKSK